MCCFRALAGYRMKDNKRNEYNKEEIGVIFIKTLPTTHHRNTYNLEIMPETNPEAAV